MCENLSKYYEVVHKTILCKQDPVTGLLSEDVGGTPHAWVRDNVYSISVVWALSMAYKRKQDMEQNRAITYLLEQATVKCMRGLMMAMMGQREKVERFKSTFCRKDALHAKYRGDTGETVVGDNDWGHLQIDATALYLLTLAQMTASGLQIVYTLDEVAFIQNLVFYIECAYVIPDYGMWERGDKSNQNIVELNSSSVGMAKAALLAISEMNLFGSRGGPASVIHVLPDETVKCAAVLESMLPRESNSKETDASILTIIGYPGFSVRNKDLVEKTLSTIIEKLGGKYGMKRFLRDGYKTPRENTARLHYETWEMRQFENIECEWPLFFCYLSISYMFYGDIEQAAEISTLLDNLTIECDNIQVIPELYQLEEKNVAKEYSIPGKCPRVPAGRSPFMWAQSLYIISKLLNQELLSPSELDPLNRRLNRVKKPDVVVQVVVLAEDSRIQALLMQEGIKLQTPSQISPYQVKPANVLSHLYNFLGRNRKLGLSGRRSLDVGIQATSRFYRVQDRVFVFTPQSFDKKMNYTDTDPCLAMSTLAYGINYLATSWSQLGRPTITLILTNDMLEGGAIPTSIITTIKKLSSGYINGTRVVLGTHQSFDPTSVSIDLAFLGDVENGHPDRLDLEVSMFLGKSEDVHSEVVLGAQGQNPLARRPSIKRKNHSGAMKRTRSIKLSMQQSKEIAEALLNECMEDAHTGPDMRTPPRMTIDDPWMVSSPRFRARTDSRSLYEDQEVDELVAFLKESRDLEEQGDILQYMVVNFGMSQRVGCGNVQQLVEELYEKSCESKHWSIVRHASGLLSKKIPNLALSLTDLIVRQKQVTVGLPPHQEAIISHPLGAIELRDLIYSVHQADISTAVLTQELLSYLAMFIRTEPNLFHGMIRIRVGLIIQVMAMELGRTLKIGAEEATEKLLNLSPFQTKNLLHHIMSGQEYEVCVDESANCSIVSLSSRIDATSATLIPSSALLADGELGDTGHLEELLGAVGDGHYISGDTRHGIWKRRRLLDGCLNRVPPDFYTKMWTVLERCQGISVGGKVLSNGLTHEMTSGEMKFHLRCETMLNKIPEPEFRQLVVEAITILILIVEHNVVQHLGGIIKIENIVQEANVIFLEDQKSLEGGVANRCCNRRSDDDASPRVCGSAGICNTFYDSAPSGDYGTMSYLVRAVCNTIGDIPTEGTIDCNVM